MTAGDASADGVTAVEPASVAAVEEALGSRLVQAGRVGKRDLERARLAGQGAGGSLDRLLVRLGLVAERDVAQALAEVLGLPLVQADRFPPQPPLLDRLSLEFLRAHRVLPLEADAAVLRVVAVAPHEGFLRKAIALAAERPVEFAVGLESEIDAALNQLALVASASGPAAADGDADSAAGDAEEFVENLRDLASEEPVIRRVNSLMGSAAELRASDVHLDPADDGLHVRYRLDGVLQRAEVIEARLGAAVVSRIKLLAQIDIAERRLPQDGRIRMRAKGRDLDLRVSTIPTVHGESVVMRLLDRSTVRLGLEDLGFPADTLQRLRHLLAQPHGIVLTTGPTGSGKSTTLYAALATLDAVALKIVTVEDPVEYQLPGISQMQVHPHIGLTFGSALRAILRQDPDIIMIGEMRDRETAQIAVQSALTGHLVLSTLHTNTAVGAIVRLIDMGVERFLLTSTVNGLLSQRLVRVLCPDCKAPDGEAAAALPPGRPLPSGATPMRPVGCARCRGIGYRGRSTISELVVMNEPLRAAVTRGASEDELTAIARASGTRGLLDDGLLKVAAGWTSLEEVLRVTEDAYVA